jgi:hypothetical protein
MTRTFWSRFIGVVIFFAAVGMVGLTVVAALLSDK